MSIDEIIEAFYDECYRKSRPMYTVKTPNIPSDMIAGPGRYNDDWIEWKLLPRAAGIDPTFANFEREVGVTFPNSFKLWHSRYFTLDGDVGFVRLPEIPSNDPFGPLRFEMFEIYTPQELRDRGFVAFGGDGWWDAGSLCFNTSADVSDGEWPIYLWDHDSVGTEQELELMFTNFQKLLECCIHNCGGTLPEYGPLPEGVEGFKIIDPTGIGVYFKTMEERAAQWKRNEE